MKKRFEEFMVSGLWILVLMLFIFLFGWITRNSVRWMILTFGGVAVIAITGAIITDRLIEKRQVEEEKIEKSKKEDKLLSLEEKYANYVLIVEETIAETLANFGLKESDFADKDVFIESKNKNYLILFEKYINWICKNRIKGKPDSFIIATCMMYALIKEPKWKLRNINSDIDEMQIFCINLNCKIAFDVAIKISSEPSTYYENSIGDWVEEKHPKVNMVVPEGMIKNSPLEERIFHSVAKDFIMGMDLYVMQMSNILHLIYLYNYQNQK